MSMCVLYEGRARGGRDQQYGLTVKHELAHRVAYAEAHGAIPEGFDVHHSCETPLCVNPEHLVALPHGEHRRRHATKTHCLRGHSLAGARVYRSRNGTLKRNCLECARSRRKEKACQ